MIDCPNYRNCLENFLILIPFTNIFTRCIHSFIFLQKTFFSQGNATTGGFCSKCWNETQKTKSAVAEAQVVAPSSPGSSEEVSSKEKATTSPSSPDKVPSLVIDATSNAEGSLEETLEDTTNTPKSSSATAAALTETPALTTENANAAAATAAAPIKKKKKKKASYKNMMASITQQSLSRDDEKEKDDAIRKVTGGGAFSKVTKI